jgi:hypothetical protein
LDILHLNGNHLRVLVRREAPPDRLLSVGHKVDGTEVRGRVTFGYAPLHDTTVHTSCTSAYPTMCVKAGGSVVAWHRVTTSFDGTPDALLTDSQTFYHTYSDARVDVQGRGWLGFASHTVTQPATGKTTVIEFDNAIRDAPAGFPAVYPYAAIPSKVTTTVTTGSGPTAREHKSTVDNAPLLVRLLGGRCRSGWRARQRGRFCTRR